MNLAEMSKLKVCNIKHRHHDLKDSGQVLLTMKKNKRLNIETKGNKRKKERVSKQKLLKGFQHSRASRIQKLFLPANHGNRQYFSFPMAPPL